MAPNNRSILVLVFLVAFLDLVGFSVIFPLFPQMLEHYVAAEGPGSAIARLHEALSAVAADQPNAKFLVVVLFGGVLGSVYSLLQFLFAPVWGSLSDRIGRRPTLLLTLAGTVLGYAGWLFAGHFWVLVVARLVGGMMAGNLSTVSAVVADVTTSANRSKGMGIVGAAIGLGFIVGPAIGGASTLLVLHDLSDSGALALNPFSGAAAIAMVLAVFNLGLAYFRFPETLPAERRGHVSHGRTASVRKMFTGVAAPGVRRVSVVSFLFTTAFSAMEFTLTFVAVERFQYTPRDNALMFVFVGFVIALVQGGVLRRLAPRFGDRRLAVAGLALLIPGFVLVGFARSTGVLYAGLGAMAFGSALATPTLSALVSQYAPRDQQGLALGLFRSLSSLSRAIGPILGGLLYWRFGSESPYVVGALLVLLPLVLSLGLPAPEGEGAPA